MNARSALLLACLALAACGPRPAPLPVGRPPVEPPPEFPPEALLVANPLPDTAEVRLLGRRLFRESCVECHGPAGRGDGPSAFRLDPRPADLAKSRAIPDHSDAWLFQRVTHGKRGTAMPSFEATYPARERWALVRALREIPERR